VCQFKKRIHVFCLALSLCALISLGAKSVSAEQLPIKTYTTADGLARDTVVHIFQDSHGFLWFSTAEGLSRFDGYEFTNYGTEQGLPTRVVNALLETRDGIYWIATANGLCRFNPNGHSLKSSAPSNDKEQESAENRNSSSREAMFVTYHFGENRRAESVNVLFEDHEGTIWCGTGGGLYRLEQQGGDWSLRLVEINPDASNSGAPVYVTQIIEDARGEAMWISTSTGLYRRTRDGRAQFYTTTHGLADNNVHTLLRDRAGRLWAGTSLGLCQLVDSPEANRSIVSRVLTEKDGLPRSYVTTLFQTSAETIWVGTGYGGFTLFDPVTEVASRRFVVYTRANGLSDAGISAMIEDRDGNLWLGTESSGVMKIARNGLTTYSEADGLKIPRIAAVFENQAGALFVVNSDPTTPLHRFDERGFTNVELQLPAGVGHSWGWFQVAFEDHTGEWWLPTNEGLYRFAKTNEQNPVLRRPKAVYTTRDGLPSDIIFRLYEDRRGDIWLSALGDSDDSLVRWERATQKFHRYSRAECLADSAATAFSEDKEGNLWIGFYTGGLVRYRDHRFEMFTNKDGVPEGMVRGLYTDHQGRLWIAASQNGLGRIDDPTAERPSFIRYTTSEGLSSNHVSCVTEDTFGRIYVGTGRGLDQLDPASGRIKHYTQKEGLSNNYVNVAFRDRTGALWFGTLNGLSRLLPEQNRSTAQPNISLSRLSIAGVPYKISELGTTEIKSLELSADQNRLQVNFLSVDFEPGDTLRYQYLLEGADKSWSALTEQRSVTYANLQPGAYRFLVRAVNANGAMSAQPATLTFTILSPIWRRWWFLAACALVFISLVLIVERYRSARVRELNAALDKSELLTGELQGQRTELSKANRTLGLEYEVTRILAQSETRGEAAPLILQQICESTGWEIGAIWRVDNRANVLHCINVWHQPGVNAAEFESLTREITFAPGVGLPGRVWASSEPLWITEMAADTNFPRLTIAAKEGLRSAFGFPVLLEGDVIGVLEFFSLQTRQHDQELIQMMSAIGGQIGQLIERKRAEEDLRESEDRMRTLAETASDAIITISEESLILFINPAAEKVFGYTIADMLGQDLTMLMPEYLRHLHQAGLNRYLQTGSRHIGWDAIELPGLHQTGREIPLEISFGEWTKNGKRYFTGIARDITERKKAEEALRKAREERLRELERVRTRIATDLHDDIGSSLTQIVVLSEVARQRTEGHDEKLSEPLIKITRVSNELVEAMSDIVWAINPKKDHMSDLVQRMRRFASDIFTSCEIKFSLHVPAASDLEVQLGANVRREIFLIFKECVNNIAKHSGCAAAEIDFYLEHHTLILRLRDDGVGFDPALVGDAYLKGGNGLISMRRRTEELGGLFEITSSQGRGATILLRVPLDGHISTESSHPNGR
jgi:PAS domain S-box-containing protein